VPGMPIIRSEIVLARLSAMRVELLHFRRAIRNQQLVDNSRGRDPGFVAVVRSMGRGTSMPKGAEQRPLMIRRTG